MASSFEQVKDLVLNKLDSVFDPPHPKALNGKPNLRYTAAVQTYLEALQPFHPWELEAGTKLALESHRYRKWPLPAELRNWCIQAQREAKPPPVKQHGQHSRELPKRAPISKEELALVREKIVVRQEWERNGKMFAKDEHGEFRHSIAELTAEARQRIATRLAESAGT